MAFCLYKLWEEHFSSQLLVKYKWFVVLSVGVSASICTSYYNLSGLRIRQLKFSWSGDIYKESGENW